jgi:hypothetical protein
MIPAMGVSMRLTRNTRVSMPFWAAILVFLVMLAAWVLVAAFWLLWAIIALPVAGIASLSHKDGLADRMIGSLRWKLLGPSPA